METALGIILGVVGGAIIGFFILRIILKKSYENKFEDLNKKIDLEIKEARITAKRIVDEAETKAEKLTSQSESKNERIKQKKIQEAKDTFGKLKSEFEPSVRRMSLI